MEEETFVIHTRICEYLIFAKQKALTCIGNTRLSMFTTKHNLTSCQALLNYWSRSSTYQTYTLSTFFKISELSFMLRHVRRTSQRNVYPCTNYHFNSCSVDNNKIGIQTEARGLTLNFTRRTIENFLKKTSAFVNFQFIRFVLTTIRNVYTLRIPSVGLNYSTVDYR